MSDKYYAFAALSSFVVFEIEIATAFKISCCVSSVVCLSSVFESVKSFVVVAVGVGVEIGVEVRAFGFAVGDFRFWVGDFVVIVVESEAVSGSEGGGVNVVVVICSSEEAFEAKVGV